MFAVVGIGFLVARTIGAKPQTPATLAYWVLGPAFIVSVLSTAEFEAEDVLRIVGSTLIAMAIVGGVAAGAGRVFGVHRSFNAETSAISAWQSARLPSVRRCFRSPES